MSSIREIQIEDRNGTVLHVTTDDNGQINAAIIDDQQTIEIEIDETDRRELADFLIGARR